MYGVTVKNVKKCLGYMKLDSKNTLHPGDLLHLHPSTLYPRGSLAQTNFFHPLTAGLKTG